MSTDDAPTAIRCAACGYQFTSSENDRCPNCCRRLTPPQIEINDSRRSSATFPGLEVAARRLAMRLRVDGRVQSNALAAQLEDIAVKLRRWQVVPPPADESTKMHAHMLELVRSGEELLSGKAPR